MWSVSGSGFNKPVTCRYGRWLSRGCGPQAHMTSSYLGLNGTVDFFKDRELHPLNKKFTHFSLLTKCVNFLLFLPICDELVQSRTKSFSQTVFFVRSHVGNTLRNILKNSRYRPFSALFQPTNMPLWGTLKMVLQILVGNPRPRCKQRASSIYFSRLLALMSYQTYSKDLFVAWKDNELGPAMCVGQHCLDPVYGENL